MSGSNSLTDSITNPIKDWFNRTPQAQRAVKKLSEDLDVVAGQVEKATSGLMEKVGPIIDPPSQGRAPGPAGASTATAEAEQAPPDADIETDPVIPESESSVPPGIKKDGEPVDPTT